jgi:leucyl aminopeptidase (aminopeptidase T)
LFDNLERRAETLTSRAYAGLHVYGETLNLLIDLSGHEWFPGIPDDVRVEELWTLATSSGLHGSMNGPVCLWVDGQPQRYWSLNFTSGHITEALPLEARALSHTFRQGVDFSKLPLVVSLVQRHHQEGAIRSHLVIGEYLGSCDVVIELGHPSVDGVLSDGSRQPLLREGMWWFAPDVVAEGSD